jgi:hypothetical protein
MLATAGMTGALLASSPLAASAAETVVGYTSTDRAAYPELVSTGGAGGVSWLAFPDEENNNAPSINGATNWRGRAGWGVGEGGWGSEGDVGRRGGGGGLKLVTTPYAARCASQ